MISSSLRRKTLHSVSSQPLLQIASISPSFPITAWFKNFFGSGSESNSKHPSVPVVGSPSSDRPSSIAKQRLKVVLSQSRAANGRHALSPPQFHALQGELLEIVSKYVKVRRAEASLAVKSQSGGLEVFELTVPLEGDTEIAVDIGIDTTPADTDIDTEGKQPVQSKRKKQQP